MDAKGRGPSWRISDRTVLVGLGNSDEGVPELAWAAAEARARDFVLQVVRAWNISQGTLPWPNSTDREIESNVRHAATSHLARAVTYLAGTWPDVEVESSVAAGVARVRARRFPRFGKHRSGGSLNRPGRRQGAGS